MNAFQRLNDWADHASASVTIERDDATGNWRCRAWDYEVSIVAVGVGTGGTLEHAVEAFFLDAQAAAVHPHFAALAAEHAKARRERGVA